MTISSLAVPQAPRAGIDLLTRQPAGDVPVRAEGVELLGVVAGSGYQTAPSLVRRADGQTLQLTPILYAVLEAIDGQRGYPEIAERLTERLGLVVAPDDIAHLVETSLRPLGVLQDANGTEPMPGRMSPLLALRCRFVISNPAVTGRIAAPFAKLFYPPVVLAVLTAFLISTAWLLFDEGLAPATRQVLYEPGLLLLVFGLTLASAAFHELGHAAACRYGGAKPGAMGAGLYLVWPAFYTDVTDSYRLHRRGRLRVDLGGLYFNAVFAVGVFALWGVTRRDALLVIIPLQLLQMARQLIPLVRFDGYHILADITGVPDLFARIRPTLLGLLPTRWGNAESKVLKPWARVVVTTWVLIVVPVLALSLVFIASTLPRLVATAWDSLGLQWVALGDHWAGFQLAKVALNVLSILALVVTVASVFYLLARIARRTANGVWRATDGNRGLRAAAVLTAVVLTMAAGAAWWPDGQYRPIEVNDRATLFDAVPTSPVAGTPTVDVIDLSHPITGPIASSAATAPLAAAPEFAVTEEVARYKFLLPDPPGEGDNQALAVNYGDGASVYEVALALLWASDGVVTPANQAYALASCSDCLTMAVAFQLILITGHADIVVPENSAVAVNVQCESCTTQALAKQLILGLVETPGPEQLAELDRIWAQANTLTETVKTMTLAETQAALDATEAEIRALFATDVASLNQAVGSEDPLPTVTPVAASNGSDVTMPTVTVAESETTLGTTEVTPQSEDTTTVTPTDDLAVDDSPTPTTVATAADDGSAPS